MKKIIKKFLLLALVFVTFTGGAFASFELPNGSKPNEELMEYLKLSIRFLNIYHKTGKKIELQDEAREFIDSVLADKKFCAHAVFAFDDIDRENIENFNKALVSCDHGLKIEAMNEIKRGELIRKQFGL